MRDIDDNFIDSAPVLNSSNCIDATASRSFSKPITEVHHSEYTLDWNNEERCTEVDVFKLDAAGGDVVYSPLSFNAVTCPDGRICTVIFSRGYNRACSDLSSLRTVQREIISLF